MTGDEVSAGTKTEKTTTICIKNNIYRNIIYTYTQYSIRSEVLLLKKSQKKLYNNTMTANMDEITKAPLIRLT